MKIKKDVREVQVLPIRNYVMKGMNCETKRNTISQKHTRFINIHHLKILKASQNTEDCLSSANVAIAKNSTFNRFKSYKSFQRNQSGQVFMVSRVKTSGVYQSYQRPRQIDDSTQIRSLKSLITNNSLKIQNYFPQRKTKKNNIFRKQLMITLQTPQSRVKRLTPPGLIIQYKQQTLSSKNSIQRRKAQSANPKLRPSKPTEIRKRSQRSHSFSQICPWNTTSIQIINAEELHK